jgi:hypothetical protein
VFPVSGPVTIPLTATLTIAGDTTIDATGAGVVLGPPPAETAIAVAGDGVALTGFAIAAGGVGIHATGVANLTIASVNVTGTSVSAFELDSTTSSTIQDSRIDDAGPAPILVTDGMDVIVQRTFVKLANKVGTVYGIRAIRGSAIHILDNTVDPGTAWMISMDSTTASEIVGNICDGAETGIALINASGIMVFRNVVTMPSTDSVYVDPMSSNNTVLNNTFYMAGDVTDDSSTNLTAMNNLVSVDVHDFVDPSTYDFHLVAGSPSIDAAMDVGQDMLPDQPARFLGKGPDLGAVESF